MHNRLLKVILLLAAISLAAQQNPPAPTSGDARDTADRAIFRATRSQKDSPRWNLAAQDEDLSVPGLLAAFACSLGVQAKSRMRRG